MAGMMTLTAKIPQALGRALAARARRDNRTKSALMREAIEALLSNNEKKKAGTVGELVGHLCGIFTGGPRDLASNPRHMEGFGK